MATKFAQRSVTPLRDDGVDVPRPAGHVVWFHVPRDGALTAVEHLIDRMARQWPALSFVVTTHAAPQAHPPATCTYVVPSFDRRGSLPEFLATNAPDVAVWVRGSLNSSQVADIAARRIPFYLVDIGVEGLDDFRGLLSKWRAKAMLRRFDRCLAVDQDAARRLQSLGAQPWRVEVTGALEEGSSALPYDEDDRRDLAEALATRPVWLAIHTPEDELGFILESHREAIRRSHRFLLVLRPSNGAATAAIAQRAKDAGFSVCLRSDAYIPTQDTEILIADMPEERGLWYRVAPITYMGGTFANQPSCNPFEPAALGSAIIHGPNICRYRGSYDRLSEAGGTVVLNDPGHLGSALNDLNFPDRAARLAHAAWDVSSSGAEVTDRITSLLHAALPMRSD